MQNILIMPGSFEILYILRSFIYVQKQNIFTFRFASISENMPRCKYNFPLNKFFSSICYTKWKNPDIYIVTYFMTSIYMKCAE